MLAVRDITRITNRSQQAIAKRDLSAYVIGERSNGGRPEKLYRSDVLRLFGVSEEVAPKQRKARNDRGRSRGQYANADLQGLFEAAEAKLLNLGEYNRHYALELALKSFGCDETASVVRAGFDYVYTHKWLPFLKKRSTEALWQARNLQSEQALQRTAFVRYDIPAILENAGIAGQGYGFGRFLMLDDRMSKIWLWNDELKRYTQHNAVYVWCVLTGALLWIEPTTATGGVGTQTYARALLSAIFAHEIPSNPIVFLENASAAASARLSHIVRHLWDSDDLQKTADDKTLRQFFGGQAPPVYRNLPHIPKSFGKAIGEAFMKTVLKRHDAAYRLQFTRVQLHVSSQHWLMTRSQSRPIECLSRTELLQREEYVDSVMQWFWSDRINDEVRSLRRWAKRHDTDARRGTIIEYYRGNQDSLASDAALSKIAPIVYLASTVRLQYRCRIVGQFSAKYEGNPIHLACAGIGFDCLNQRLGACLNPTKSDRWLIFRLDDEGDAVEFLGEGVNAYAESFEQAIEAKLHTAAVRRATTDRINTELRERLSKKEALGIERSEGQPLLPSPAAEAKTVVIEADDDADADYNDMELMQYL